MLLFIAGLLPALGARSPTAILVTAVAGSFGVFHVFLTGSRCRCRSACSDFEVDAAVDTFQHLLTGLAAAASLQNLGFALIGCLLGTLIGVLPGLGPTAGTAILIPLTFSLDPTGALIMLSAIYYGAMYGGTITSVLINVPGEAASVITCFDGYQMARQGRAGTALGIAAIGSFIGGIAATIALIVVAPPLARLALSFGPPEFFALMLVGLALITGLAGHR